MILDVLIGWVLPIVTVYVTVGVLLGIFGISESRSYYSRAVHAGRRGDKLLRDTYLDRARKGAGWVQIAPYWLPWLVLQAARQASQERARLAEIRAGRTALDAVVRDEQIAKLESTSTPTGQQVVRLPKGMKFRPSCDSCDWVYEQDGYGYQEWQRIIPCEEHHRIGKIPGSTRFSNPAATPDDLEEFHRGGGL